MLLNWNILIIMTSFYTMFISNMISVGSVRGFVWKLSVNCGGWKVAACLSDNCFTTVWSGRRFLESQNKFSGVNCIVLLLHLIINFGITSITLYSRYITKEKLETIIDCNVTHERSIFSMCQLRVISANIQNCNKYLIHPFPAILGAAHAGDLVVILEIKLRERK